MADFVQRGSLDKAGYILSHTATRGQFATEDLIKILTQGQE